MTSLRTSGEFVQKVVASAKAGLTYEEIAEILGTSRNIVNHAISANNRGLGTIAELDKNYSKRREFQDWNHYQRYRRLEKNLQRSRQRNLAIHPTSILEIILQRGKGIILNREEVQPPQIYEENPELLKAINNLPRLQREIIRGIFYERKTQAEIAEENRCSHENISEGYKLALNNIKKYLKGEPKRKKQQRAIQDGELLLAYILHRTPKRRGKLEETISIINELFHEGKNIRTKYFARDIIYSSYYKERLQSLIARYFPKTEAPSPSDS